MILQTRRAVVIFLLWTAALVGGGALRPERPGQVQQGSSTVAPTAQEPMYSTAHQIRSQDGKIIALGGIEFEIGKTLDFSKPHGGFWEVNAGKVASALFTRQGGNSVFATIEIRGRLSWKRDGTVIEGLNNLVAIETAEQPKVRNTIVKCEQLPGGARIATDTGKTFVVSDFRFDFTGTIR